MAAAGNEIRLNVVVMITDTQPENGAVNTVMKYRGFTLPHEPLLKVETALPLMREVVEFCPLPTEASIVDKVVESAQHLLLLPGTTMEASGALPMTTVRISVDHGVVSVAGDFDEEEDDSDTDSDDEDDDGGDEQGEGMEVEVKEEEVKEEEVAMKME